MIVPKTPEEMIAMLVEHAKARAYVGLGVAARQKRLTEYDIGLVERETLQLVQHRPRIADEFRTFETEPAFAKARALIQQFFEAARAARADQVPKK